MSFLFENDEFLTQVIKIAQQQTAAPAQAPAAPNLLQEAKKLVDNLQREMSGGFNFTAERDNADLSQAHLVNLGELFNFLEFNGIKANGHQLVLKAQQWKDTQTGKMTNIIKQMGEAGKAYVAFPSGMTPQYYIYRDGIVGYLKDLGEQAADNPMLKAVLSKLNNEFNTKVPGKTTPPTDVAGNSSTPTVNPQTTNQNVNQKLASLMSNLPFTLRNIDFDRIDRFLNGVADLMTGTSQQNTVNSTIAQIRDEMQNFSTKFMNHNERVFPLGLAPADYVTLLKDKTKGYLGALDTLGKILNGTRSVFASLDSQYGDNLKAYKNQIDGQIGATYTDNSIYFENVTSLRTLARAANINLQPGVK